AQIHRDADRAPQPVLRGSASGSTNTHRVVRGVPHTRVSFLLPDDLLERARNATLGLSGPPMFMRLGQLVRDGISSEVARLEKRHNGGQAFPKLDRQLRGG